MTKKNCIQNIPDIVLLDKEKKNPFLYCVDNKWYTNDYSKVGDKDEKIKYFVNFVVLKNFSLDGINEWDRVQRSTMGPGDPLGVNILAAAITKQWSTYRKSQIPSEQVSAMSNNFSGLNISSASSSKQSK